MQEVCQQSLAQITALAERLSMPIPQVQVIVPEQATPIVNLTVPKHLPEVIVNIPELKSPEVVVNIPQPRLVKKHISYNDYGQPETIVEEPGE